MKKKILFLGLSVLLVAAMVITSCSTKTATTTQTTGTTVTTTSQTTVTTTTTTTTSKTTTASTTATGTPQYGGTLVVMTDMSGGDPGGWDGNLTPTPWSTACFDDPFIPIMMAGDIEKYGPRGSNKYTFNTTEYIPEEYLMGPLAQSWEILSNPLTIRWHIRHGVMWAANPRIGMVAREVTADDVVYSQNRSMVGTMAAGSFTFVTSRVKVDKYTVDNVLNRFDANWAYYLGYGYYPCMIVPPEVGNTTAAGGNNDWRNQASAGPFILTDFVPGAGATYTRNPNYNWMTTTINGKQYQMPFIDTLILPVMGDNTTMVTALRTGKLDWWPQVPVTYAATLKQSSPQLVEYNFPSNRPYLFRMNRIDNQYLKVKDVRRALQIGTNFAEIRDLVFPGGGLIGWPVAEGNPAYTPLDQMPASIQELFKYDATKAKSMITAAGFPSGFTLTVTIGANDPVQESIANILVSQWAKIGVTLKIRVFDTASFNAVGDSRQYDMLTMIMSTSNPFVPLNWSNVGPNPPNNSWLYYYQTESQFPDGYKKMMAETDPVKRTQYTKDLALLMIDDCGWMQFANPVGMNCWWPWMKNYYNETDTGYHNQCPMIERTWIDQNLKKTLVGQ